MRGILLPVESGKASTSDSKYRDGRGLHFLYGLGDDGDTVNSDLCLFQLSYGSLHCPGSYKPRSTVLPAENLGIRLGQRLSRGFVAGWCSDGMETWVKVIGNIDACCIVSLLGCMAAVVLVASTNWLRKRYGLPNDHWTRPLIFISLHDDANRESSGTALPLLGETDLEPVI